MNETNETKNSLPFLSFLNILGSSDTSSHLFNLSPLKYIKATTGMLNQHNLSILSTCPDHPRELPHNLASLIIYETEKKTGKHISNLIRRLFDMHISIEF